MKSIYIHCATTYVVALIAICNGVDVLMTISIAGTVGTILLGVALFGSLWQRDGLIELVRGAYQGMDDKLKPFYEEAVYTAGWNPAAILDPDLEDR